MSTSHDGAADASRAARASVQADEPSRILTPPRLLLPISTRDGLLPPGTSLQRGQRLFASEIALERMPLAPVDGTLGEVVEAELIGGGRSTAVELASLIHASADVFSSPAAAPAAVPARDFAGLIEQLRRGGLFADRRTCPNLLAQLNRAMQRPIDTVLCSLLDAPGGHSMLNAAALSARGAELLAGIKAISTASGANRVWIVAEAELVRRAAVSFRKDDAARSIRMIEIDNAYPQADPTLLLFALLGRRLRPGRLPPEVGCIFMDGPAAVAIGQCLGAHADNAPAAPPGHLETVIQLRDARRGESRAFIVPLGTPLRCVLDAASIDKAEAAIFHAGAALSDVQIGSIDAIIDGHELIIDITPAAPAINPEPCIRCGWCVEACPVRIHPARLLEAAQENDTAAAARFGLDACIECGICSYVCPSRLPLLKGIRQLRKRAPGGLAALSGPA